MFWFIKLIICPLYREMNFSDSKWLAAFNLTGYDGHIANPFIDAEMISQLLPGSLVVSPLFVLKFIFMILI